MQIPIVGQSYNLTTRKADVQRSINLFPSIVESGSGKSPAILQSIPGLTLFSTPTGAVRGLFYTSENSMYAVAGNKFYHISSLGVATEQGTLSTATGSVDITQNLNQIIIVDGANGYTYTFAGNIFSRINDAAFYGSDRVGVVDGYAIFIKPNSQVFYISAVDDANTYDGLDFASAEGNPDNLVAIVADHAQVVLFGSSSTEIWEDIDGNDFPFARNNGARIETGCIAAHSAKKLDNTVIWLGSDERGGGMVWKLSGYTPVRISTQAIEEAIQSVTDLSGAVAYTYQQDGNSFYVLNIPGLLTSLVFDVATGAWHERAELVDGEYTKHRGTCHAYAYGKHYVGADDGKIYQYDATANTNNGDILVRDRITPHQATPDYDQQVFGSLQVDCEVGHGVAGGVAPTLTMRYSNDGGYTYGAWHSVSMGAVGKRLQRCIFRRLSSAYDRVWQIRCTDDTQLNIVGANLK